ncbi:MAG TPA: imidazoleglycerol-phosphate dehydratase HisB [Bacteroidota bacterium]|nr:imidazoleglycerol-phosphate dehydratase HisB [Bacteroidota bacterium]
MRSATIQRKTKETNISVSLRIDGSGKYTVSTGIGFLDHMMELFARHGMFDIQLKCKGDLHVDDHHTTEDVAIALGQAFGKALKERAGIARYGSSYVPMDESLARCVVDLGGRSALVFKAEFNRKTVGDLSTEMIRHFFQSFAENIKANIHVEVLYGSNTHHKIEAMFKSLARALRAACERDARVKGVLSTKGKL